MKASGSAAPGPVLLRRALAAPERLGECDATAEARGSGGSGELIVAEKSEKRCVLVSRGSQRLKETNWKAQAARTREPRPSGAEGQRPERLTSEP
jgi:hypothetical protein